VNRRYQPSRRFRNQCAGKVRHADEREALWHLSDMLHRDWGGLRNPEQLEVYICRHCGYMHVGHKPIRREPFPPALTSCLLTPVIRFESHQDAWVHMLDAAEQGEVLVVYRCRLCQGWHTVPPRGPRATHHAAVRIAKAKERRERRILSGALSPV
jgi:rubrerythrin